MLLRSFRSQRGTLIVHIEAKHCIEKIIQVYHVFRTRDCLSYHISTIHIEIHKCDQCSCTFASPSHLERHLEIHEDEEYICEVCAIKLFFFSNFFSYDCFCF